MRMGYLLSVFDMVDVGDVDVVRQAAERTDRVEARVLSDETVFGITGQQPVIPERERLEIIGSVREVADAAIYDASSPLKVRDEDIVYGRRDVAIGRMQVDHWLEPRLIPDSAQELTPPLELAAGGGVLGYVPGAWDRFHIGHLNILRRARDNCDRLVVGVVSDNALFEAKGKLPMVPLAERMRVVAAMDIVDATVVDYSSSKLEVWDRVHFDILFKGDDWRGTAKGDRLEAEMASVGATVHYFPYTAHTSSTALRQILATR
ncbi:MAG: adenylyltransferase/cytidyltransferase family protein [Propionicimonas sp.]|uniref:adenylyltransferase/cytidyltransferase family protein n=1 Tax=Propionicimonas sp. TaxID=1955623 RepID=UPI002B1F294B|nr:adenylyltransferase/cytidyltransferase family protein [Propionicimonas sp.]MEA4945869.1 adenylyltransferase/cytidyltransferase family protein [Propionicimonas sp.]MEA5053979.1 adenylyltransferase/cytidyltransferase family protein [Propionicimonas sp.]MEA5116808.1 adenylyltransferase/cytidyltransferase family protein [Propionicimonas sp.]